MKLTSLLSLSAVLLSLAPASAKCKSGYVNGTDPDSDGLVSQIDSCPFDPENDVDGDGVCTQCCGIFLGPNGGSNGEYEVQVDLSGVAPAVNGTAGSGVYTIKAKVFVTDDWDGSDQLLHARAWDSSNSVIKAISGDDSTEVRGEWTWVEADIDMSTSVPARVSVYFGYPMQSTTGYVLLDELLFVDEDGKNWVPFDGNVDCGYGFHEGQYHGSGDSYGNIGVIENACDYDDFALVHMGNCNDADSDNTCGAEDICPYDYHNDVDSDGLCGDVDSCASDAANDADGDGICAQCCGIQLGPNGGSNGEYEVQVDLSGDAPAVNGTAINGTYTIRAKVYVTSAWDGSDMLLHARAWDSSGSVITAISGDDSTKVRDKWTWVDATINMGDSIPYRVSVYFGYPMQSSRGYVLLDELLLVDGNGMNWVPNHGYVDCGYGFHEGKYHGSGDSYGNVDIIENACDYDGFAMLYVGACNDADSDGVCAPDDPCPYDMMDDEDSDGLCKNVDSCPVDGNNDADGDGICTQCCGIFLGPNGGNYGEWEVQVDMSGESPGVLGDALDGEYTIRALIYVTEDWDGTLQMLHARAWDASGVITSIGGDNSTGIRGRWRWVEATIDMGSRTPTRVSVYFGYPMTNTQGYVYLSQLLFLDENGKNWVPFGGYVTCDYGIHEGDFHGSSDSYGNIGVLENACEYDGFDTLYLGNCNDADSDDVCAPEDSCTYDHGNDADSDMICGDVDSCATDAENDVDGDGICGQCCGVQLGPNGGGNGEWEVQVDLSGDSPGIEADAISGTYTIRAHVYVTSDWDGKDQLLHARAWTSGGSVIGAVSGDDSTEVRDEWVWVEKAFSMGTSTPATASIYFGYPMQSKHGYVLVDQMQFVDANGLNWIPNDGYANCAYGFFEGKFHGSSDSYGNVKVLDNACEYDGFDMLYVDSCNDADSDGLCAPDDRCIYNVLNDQDSDGLCEEVDSCPNDPENDADGDGFCTQCCGIYLGPNSGGNGEWEVQVDLSGAYPGVGGTAPTGKYNISARVFVTDDWDGSNQLLHARAWSSSGVITAISGDKSTEVRGEWTWVSAIIDMSTSVPDRVSIYFGYPMQSTTGYVYLDTILLTDSAGKNWVPMDGYVSCGYGPHEGQYHGTSDSYGNIGILENACDFDEFSLELLDRGCVDRDEDGVCSEIDSCPMDALNDADSDLICGNVDSCPFDSSNDAEDDGVCTQCCGIYLGPNSGNYGEYEVQVDLSGDYPGVNGTAGSGNYTIKGLVYVTSDWDGTTQLFHARAWDSSSTVIRAISGDYATLVRDEWNWVEVLFEMGDATPYRVSIYFGYPMKNTAGYVLLDELLFVDEDGTNWVPNDGFVSCSQGFSEGKYHGTGDSYGNQGIADNACFYDGWVFSDVFNCNDADSDGVCTPDDVCPYSPDDDLDSNGQCAVWTEGALWDASIGGPWGDKGNWLVKHIPGADDVAVMDSNTEFTVTIDELAEVAGLVIAGDVLLEISECDDAYLVIEDEAAAQQDFVCPEPQLVYPGRYTKKPVDTEIIMLNDETTDFYIAASAYTFECSDGYESTNEKITSITINCQFIDSFSTFDITEHLECVSATTAPVCGLCGGSLTCDELWLSEQTSCSSLESDYDCDCSGCECAGDCTANCFEQSCDEWEEYYGTTCDFLEDSYDCDCSGCACAKTPSYECPATCFDLTCPELVATSSDLSFSVLEDEYSCDCSGCTTTTSTSTTTEPMTTTTTTEEEYTGLPLTTTTTACPATCYGHSCDTLYKFGYNCSSAEEVFSCNCGGCSCTPPTTTTEVTTVQTTTTTTTTALNACGVRVMEEYYYSGFSSIHYCIDFEVSDSECPGCENVEMGTDEVLQLYWDTPGAHSVYITQNKTAYDMCDFSNAAELAGDDHDSDHVNFDASDYSDGVYYLMSGTNDFGIVQYCEVFGQKFRVIVGTVADGCMNVTGCNYDADNIVDTLDACTFPPAELTCAGECVVDYDECGVCGGLGVGESQSGVDGSFIDPDHGRLANLTGTVGGCKKKNWVSDGNCDDFNNNCMCGWDGGDCCGTNNNYAYCTSCSCLDPTFTAPAPSYCGRSCWKSTYADDGFCDDANNFCGCDWDGGDCCGTTNNYNYCDGCECLDPDFTVPAPAPSDGCAPRCGTACNKPAYAADGVCDDINNVCGCDWDGGDCCGIGNSYTFCQDCECRDCNFVPDSDECAPMLNPCKKSAWAGDGACDDVNNLAGCDWDGGDCCGPENSYLYCTECECLDCTYVPDSDACVDAIFGSCAKANYVGDGYCDDSNNNAGCNWDDGDCCGIDNNYDFCDQCLCLNCTYPVLSDNCTVNIQNGCGAKAFQGDGFCDDSNNNAGCDWDMGDCCDPEADKSYCNDCECLDCTYVFEGDDCVSSIKSVCGSANYQGDGYCDDANNNAGCDWDGGDCCGPTVQKDWCDDCLCLDCTYIPEGDDCVDSIQGSCSKPKFVGDGYCDDSNNNAGCDWDNGDCCGPDNNYQYCSACACLDCTYEAQGDDCVASFSATCKNANFQGDGYCDDGNNVGGCDWDGGDCCGTSVKKNWCTDCLCLDCTYEQDFCTAECAKNNLVGDGFCDDGNNNCGCDWDEGDCCGSSGKNKQYNYCNACACLDPDSAQGGCTAPCWKNSYKADGFCDDANNLCGCDWDGGDCCAGKTNYCTECLCLDPDYGSGECAGSCWKSAYKTDGFCDDGNNLCGCDWDGGDCCGDSGKGKQYNFCSDCDCLDPSPPTTPASGDCTMPCDKPNLVGDGFCDDGNNNCGCDWDEGDCCGQSGKGKQYNYCSACACLDPAMGDGCAGSCQAPNYVGDGFCDDANNNCGCDWDEGDCCGDSGKGKQYNYCNDCSCLDPDSQPSFCSGSCDAANYVGDGFCDDDNNNCGCDWDEGDCCGDSGKGKQYNYCDDCSCKDPTQQSACPSNGVCGSANYVGDGFCDDANNNCGCDWDEGDCCGDSGKGKQYNYCDVCACLEPSTVSTPAS